MTPPTRGKDTGSSKSRQKFSGNCFCCGKVGHRREQCRMKDEMCRGCGKKGHLVRVCRNKSSGQRKKHQLFRKKPVHHLENSEEESDDNLTGALYTMDSTSKPRPYVLNMEINGKPLQMEIDTGASLTLVSERTFRDYWPTLNLSHTRVKLYSYSGESVPVVGTVEVTVKYESKVAILPLIVVKGEGPSLLGRNWLCEMKLNWHEIFWLHNESLSQVLEKHKAVFERGLGIVTGYEAKILVDQNAIPKYCKARTVPYFYREKVEKELDRLVEEGTLEPV